LYRQVVDEIGVSFPERHYDLAAQILAGAIKRAKDSGGAVDAALGSVAEEKGREFGMPGDFPGALKGLGYEPAPDGSGGYLLLNCPFHRLSADHQELVCSMNGSFLAGAAGASGLSSNSVTADPDHERGHCCARIHGDQRDA